MIQGIKDELKIKRNKINNTGKGPYWEQFR